MIDKSTIENCKRSDEILQLKIRYLEHAIKQAEEMIIESQVNDRAMIFLRRKVADSKQDLEVLYLLKKHKNEQDLY